MTSGNQPESQPESDAAQSQPETQSRPEIQSRMRLLRTVHRATLATLAVVALVIAAGSGGVQEGSPERGYTGAALALAVLSIGARIVANGPKASGTTALRFQLIGLVLAGAIGFVGLLVAIEADLWKTGLFYTLAGGMLAMRPPTAISRPSPTNPGRDG